MKKPSSRPTSDDSPGAVAVPGSFADSPRPATYRSFEPEEPYDNLSNDGSVEESKQEEDGGDRGARISTNNVMIDENKTYIAEAYEVVDEEHEHGGLNNHNNGGHGTSKWYNQPSNRIILIVGIVFFACAVVGGIVALVVVLLRQQQQQPLPPSFAPTSMPTASLQESQQVACDFLGLPFSECIRTKTFYSDTDGRVQNGTTIPTEIGTLTMLTY